MNRKIIFTSFIILITICLANFAFAHETEYPEPYIDNPKVNEVVSGDVDFNISVEDHHETLYVNVTATHHETKTVYFHAQDSNPADGWSLTWDTSDAPNGKYYIESVAMNSANLKGQYNIMITLNNTKKDTSIILDETIGVVNESNTIMAHLLDGDSKPLANKDISFKINDETFKTTTTNDGAALIAFTPKEAKIYDITAKFTGDNVYGESQAEMAFNVLANSTVITVTDITGNNREKILLKANLRNNKGLNSDKKIDFYINGVNVGSALTDSNGDAELNYTITETGGKYAYRAEFVDEDATYSGVSTLYIPESSMYVRITATTFSKDGIFTVGNNVRILYDLFNEGPDSAENVIFKLNVPNSLSYIASKPSTGNVSFNKATNEFEWRIGNADIGNQSVEIEFKATSSGKNNLAPAITTDTYDKSINNNITRNTIIVKSYKLAASNLVKYFTSSKKLKVYLKDEDGKSVSGATINILFNKQTISLKTNSKGYIELDATNLKVGKHTIKATCNGLSKSIKITVKPLIVTKNISKKKSKSVKFTAKLLDKNGKVVKNKKISFKLKGKTYTAKTNNKGIATLSLNNLKVGKYTIQSSYGKSTVKNTITIKK